MPTPVRRLRRPSAVAVLTLALALGGCAAAPPAEPAPEPVATAPATAAPTDTSTLRTLIGAAPEHPELTERGPAEPIGGERAIEVSYLSGGLTVSGVVRTPRDSTAPAATVVVVHGSVDPDRYVSGGDLIAEQRGLLEAGYAVFALDMRGYAGSDPADAANNPVIDPGFGWSTVLDWGMALDVVNGLRLVRGGAVPGADPDRVGLLGHSLGGLLSLDAAVIAPGSSDLVVALSAPSADFSAAVAGASDDLTGTSLPAASDAYWADISPATFFERATEPLLLIHGRDDDVAPAEASEATAAAWNAAGGRAEALILDGADHALSPRRSEVAGIVVSAFDSVLGAH